MGKIDHDQGSKSTGYWQRVVHAINKANRMTEENEKAGDRELLAEPRAKIRDESSMLTSREGIFLAKRP